MQDRQSVEQSDATIAAHISSIERCGIARGGAATGCDYKRDRGVCEGEFAVRVVVVFLWRGGSSRLHEREAVDTFAAGDRVWVFADAVAV
uniref:Uncharacterized protein n=1 Tax=Candidatus Methanogaster sp. ANME-2c ERB4 TaxID=2759911 RepID=A0A7G9YIN4_9EURY|nr:hypothetical protein DJFEGNLO_00022 [Methanosarcinales archaeon ANME-2c ERB4]